MIKKVRSVILCISVSILYTLSHYGFSSAQSPENASAYPGDIQIYIPDTPTSEAFNKMLEKGVSYISPVISHNENNNTQSGDAVYMVFFKPMDKGQWRGNLKKYGLSHLERKECPGRVDPEWTIVDKNDDIAVDCDGAYIEGSISYWSIGPDGDNIEKGGAGERLLKSVPEPDAYPDPDDYYSFRNIYTAASDGSVIPLKSVSNAELNADTDTKRQKILNYMYGYTYESEERSGVPGFPVAKRGWILGDIIHSRPEIIDYNDQATGKLRYRYIAVGANDGMLHVFTDSPVFFNGKAYSPGDEIFAFVPRDLLPKLDGLAGSSSHIYMVDGSPGLFHLNIEEESGYLEKTLVFGEGRGGKSYWALDVSSSDPSSWSVKWHISGGSEGIATPVTRQINELGYTWNKPFFTNIRIAGSGTKNIMIFAGGYDPLEDGFPEAFSDSNNNGKWDAAESHTVADGGTAGYDRYNPGTDLTGRGIFVVDMDDGSVLFNAVYGEGIEKKTGVSQVYNDMKYCFPADISIIPFSEKHLLMYAADIYGQIWKIVYDYDEDKINSYENELSTRWKVKRIFASNPGSSLAPGIGSGLAAPFTDSEPDTPSFDNSDQGRKTFYSPDISFTGNEWTNRPVLYFGTGDRAHPRFAMISNRFYAFADTDSLIYETDLLNLTCNELDADANNDGDESVRNELKNLFYDNKVKGFYRVMDKQGDCKDGIYTDHTGEHILSQPRLFAGIIYFTSYQPVFSDPSNPAGNIYIYALDYSFGISVFNNPTNDKDDNVIKTLEDTYYRMTGNAIPSGIEILTKGGHVSGLTSTGDKLSGIAEQQSTNIPAPPGGVSQMLWEVE